MARETTPGAWPSVNRGFLDDAVEALGLSKLFGRLSRRASARFAPGGEVQARLSRDQAVTLTGPCMARVGCLEGTIWVTCPSDGRDQQLSARQEAVFPGGGQVVVTAAGGPARVRLYWK